jgi:hypothetical protein
MTERYKGFSKKDLVKDLIKILTPAIAVALFLTSCNLSAGIKSLTSPRPTESRMPTPVPLQDR